jgi:hypothetical protein
MNRWAPSRTLWNEHSYHITNVNDDLTVPSVEQPNWKTWNNYRQNVQARGKSGPIPDFTGGVFTGVDPGSADCKQDWTLRANICNRGTGTLDPGVPGTFYTSDPRVNGAMPICTGVTTDVMAPGQCVRVQCDWKNPQPGPLDLYFRADDDGSGKELPAECKNGNNLLILPQAMCGKIG